MFHSLSCDSITETLRVGVKPFWTDAIYSTPIDSTFSLMFVGVHWMTINEFQHLFFIHSATYILCFFLSLGKKLIRDFNFPSRMHFKNSYCKWYCFVKINYCITLAYTIPYLLREPHPNPFKSLMNSSFLWRVFWKKTIKQKRNANYRHCRYVNVLTKLFNHRVFI